MRTACSGILIGFLFAHAGFAQTLIVNDNITLARDPGFADVPGPDIYTAVVIQGSNGDFTNALFGFDGNELTLQGVTLDEGSDWYAVSPGDVFGFETLEARRFRSGSVGTDGFYLGVATSSNFDVFPVRDVFGWAHLVSEGGQLVMLENAVAYDSEGIVVGTTQLVPEPSGLVQASLAIATISMLRRRRGRCAGWFSRHQLTSTAERNCLHSIGLASSAISPPISSRGLLTI